MINTSFRVLLEVPQRGADDPYYRDIFQAEYVQGRSPHEDELSRRHPVADSSSSEWSPAWTPDGRAAFLSERERHGLYLAGPGQPLLLLAHRGVRSFSPSPDGGEWLFTTKQGLFRLRGKGGPIEVPLDGLRPVQVTHAPNGEVYFSTVDALYRLAQPVERVAEGDFDEFSFSPDGRSIAYIRPGGDTDELRVRRLDTGEDRLLRTSADESQTYCQPSYASPAFSPDGSRVLYCVRSFEGSSSNHDLRVVAVDGSCAGLIAYDVMAARPR